jgi:hypothetical protein
LEAFIYHRNIYDIRGRTLNNKNKTLSDHVDRIQKACNAVNYQLAEMLYAVNFSYSS